MPRKPRLQSSTDYYHVMMRGNNKEKIFFSSAQKNFFLDCLDQLNEDRLISIVAYCIMDNHVHLVVKADIVDLSNYLKKVNTKYAVSFNNLNKRVGHVFQGRYKSEAICDEDYLTNVIRYVHNNPVRAKIINNAKDYKWSSYNEFTNEIKIVSSSLKDFILTCYGGINNFIEFHKDLGVNEYLDTKEEIEEYRYEIAQEIISKYFNDNGINEISEIKNHPTHLEDIIKCLIFQTKLSNRQLARLLNISYYTVSSLRGQFQASNK